MQGLGRVTIAGFSSVKSFDSAFEVRVCHDHVAHVGGPRDASSNAIMGSVADGCRVSGFVYTLVWAVSHRVECRYSQGGENL